MKLFFLLSGENPTLPTSEVLSILRAEGYKYKLLETLPQILRVDSSLKCVDSIRARAALTRICGLELLRCKAEINNIYTEVKNLNINGLIGRGESFAVRVRRIRGSSPEISRLKLEREIGRIILRKTEGAKVRLEKPDKTLIGILTGGVFILGMLLAEINPKEFVNRRPRKRLFFHPTAMPAKLARCMVNLSRPVEGSLVMDPFCGTGSFLIEAGLIGCRILGFDADRRMIRGSFKNLRYYGLDVEGLAVADARHLPISNSTVDSVVTDPPYGFSAKTFGIEVKDLIETFMRDVADKIRIGGIICIAAPHTIRISEIGEKIGLKHLESHFVYVHRRLTREISVFVRG